MDKLTSAEAYGEEQSSCKVQLYQQLLWLIESQKWHWGESSALNQYISALRQSPFPASALLDSNILALLRRKAAQQHRAKHLPPCSLQHRVSSTHDPNAWCGTKIVPSSCCSTCHRLVSSRLAQRAWHWYGARRSCLLSRQLDLHNSLPVDSVPLPLCTCCSLSPLLLQAGKAPSLQEGR